ncbi:MAG: anaerobic ribonucleoside-triphosphate reductase activating protein [Clostridia bacterium]|nr:anaerobic ribonucleoside-triphosphate reductase activating protein [Clostridia bacterium]
MTIGGVQRSSLSDFPGLPSAIVFTRGCNFRCPWCHNAQLLEDGENIPEAEVLQFLESRRGKLLGVVITGGEPTVQPDLDAFLGKCRDLGFRTKLDTNGGRPNVLKTLLDGNLLDYCAIDLKLPIRRYSEITDVDGKRVLESIELVKRAGITHEVRTTVPSDMTLSDLFEIVSECPSVEQYHLQPCIEAGAEHTAGPDLARMAEGLRVICPNVKVRGA